MLEVKSERLAEQLRLTIIGDVQETAQLPAIDFNGTSTILVDMNGFGTMNSEGIRKWIPWVAALAQGDKLLQFDNCPIAFLQVASVCVNVLPEKAKILTAFFPFVTPEGEDRLVKVDLRNFKNYEEALAFLKAVRSPEGDELEMDFFPKQILSFMK